MNLEIINDMLIRNDLASLEKHFFRTYRGQVPDIDTYNQSIEDAFKMKEVKYGKVRHVIYDESIGKYKYMNQHSPERVQRKLLIIDAILTIKHRKKLGLHTCKGQDNFDIYTQLSEVV